MKPMVVHTLVAVFVLSSHAPAQVATAGNAAVKNWDTMSDTLSLIHI